MTTVTGWVRERPGPIHGRKPPEDSAQSDRLHRAYRCEAGTLGQLHHHVTDRGRRPGHWPNAIRRTLPTRFACDCKRLCDRGASLRHRQRKWVHLPSDRPTSLKSAQSTHNAPFCPIDRTNPPRGEKHGLATHRAHAPGFEGQARSRCAFCSRTLCPYCRISPYCHVA